MSRDQRISDVSFMSRQNIINGSLTINIELAHHPSLVILLKQKHALGLEVAKGASSVRDESSAFARRNL